MTLLPPHLTEAHRPFFDSFEEVFRHGSSVFRAFDSRLLDFQTIMSACLFGRLLEVGQAVALLTWNGFSQDASVSLRIALETLLRLRVACLETETARKLVHTDLLE